MKKMAIIYILILLLVSCSTANPINSKQSSNSTFTTENNLFTNYLNDLDDYEKNMMDNLCEGITLTEVNAPGEISPYRGVSFLTTLGKENATINNGTYIPNGINTYIAGLTYSNYYAAYYPTSLQEEIDEELNKMFNSVSEYNEIVSYQGIIDGKIIKALYNLKLEDEIIWKKTLNYSDMFVTNGNYHIAFIIQKIEITATYDMLNMTNSNLSSILYFSIKSQIKENKLEKMNNELSSYIDNNDEILISFSEDNNFYNLTKPMYFSLDNQKFSLKINTILNGYAYIYAGYIENNMEYITDTSILTIKDMSEIVSIKINDNRSKIYYKISIEDLKSIINS